MHINDLPQEIFDDILNKAIELYRQDGASFTYGLSQVPLPTPLITTKVSKYVRGPLSFESLRWDSSNGIRQVCSKWHEWAITYNTEHIFERRWRGAERWADLTLRRPNYDLYELIEYPKGLAVYRDPYSNLKQTDSMLSFLPQVAAHVKRLWFNGFYVAETDRMIMNIIALCPQLEYLSLPWTILRRGTVDEWAALLKHDKKDAKPLYSLEIQSICLPTDQAQALEEDESPSPLLSDSVNFSSLSRLKFFGNTLHKSIVDEDLYAIARTATNLTCLDFTNISTISVAGMLALVKASSPTLRVLEHSPRSSDGFYHPYPGHLSSNEHICALLTSLPAMQDLSISIPHMCSSIFESQNVKWEGEVQVRATDICTCDVNTPSGKRSDQLQNILTRARELINARRRLGHQLSIELFFAGSIFEPEKKLIHGDFTISAISSGGTWPRDSRNSTKGPYGSSGTYGKGDETWDAVLEEEYFYGVDNGWVAL